MADWRFGVSRAADVIAIRLVLFLLVVIFAVMFFGGVRARRPQRGRDRAARVGDRLGPPNPEPTLEDAEGCSTP